MPTGGGLPLPSLSPCAVQKKINGTKSLFVVEKLARLVKKLLLVFGNNCIKTEFGTVVSGEMCSW